MQKKMKKENSGSISPQSSPLCWESLYIDVFL